MNEQTESLREIVEAILLASKSQLVSADEAKQIFQMVLEDKNLGKTRKEKDEETKQSKEAARKEAEAGKANANEGGEETP